jgi:CRP-like cAMP-binding protein
MLERLRQYVSGYVPLTDEEFALLAENITIRSFGKRELLVRAGENELYMNFVVKGLVRMYFYHSRTEIITNIRLIFVGPAKQLLCRDPRSHHLVVPES